ncbi:hypothetical protein Patl1_03245 [Pistacia atlantica]|uniref:Uncharacterized protein n=1 Tax=Pistacia atlantica TaxID=434234 RepID=A0ACC1C8P1_9ROSI|nr:hypothetical protein Patl1_03245 [Pistacia atlantica]
MESDVDATMLACIAFSCPHLECMEISTSDTAVNRITGDELGRFVADKRCLTNLKMEGCSNLGGFGLCSSSLSTLWLSDLNSLSKMVFNCPNLKEISMEFSRQENDSNDLTAMADGLVRNCPRLQNIHIASTRLSHAVVLAITAASLRFVNYLLIVVVSHVAHSLDDKIWKLQSVLPHLPVQLTSGGCECFHLYLDLKLLMPLLLPLLQPIQSLELLDLSGSSISDSGIGMICNVFPNTLSRLLLALCPNITSSGIQFATAQLPLLELMDCGMSICDPNSENRNSDEASEFELQSAFNNKLHIMYQKLIIKHCRLKKLSLWGCSGLDALFLNCPELNDLNLNSCRNLRPETLLLQCPKLESVHASGCQELMIGTIQSQVNGDSAPLENQYAFKRSADGSKRVRLPHSFSQQPSDDDMKRRRVGRRQCNILVD